MDFLNRFFRGDRVVWVIFIILILVSVIEVFSAASTLTYIGDRSYLWAIRGHSTNLLLGFIVVYIAHLIPYRFYKAVPIVLLPVSVGMLIWLLFDKSDAINDASRWIPIGPISIQPSELAKVGVVMGTALILSRTQTDDGATPDAFKWLLGMSLVVCGLIMPENLSTAALLFLVVLGMMWVGRIPWSQYGKLLLSLVVVGTMFLSIMIFVPPTTLSKIPVLNRLETWQGRILRFVHPSPPVPAAQFTVPDDKFQEVHATMAIASSNIVGRGPGNSVERDILPQAYSDFIFAIIIEELGLLGGIGVVFLYLWLLVRAAKIARRCRSYFPAFLVMGCALMLVAQAMLNMMVAVGLFPVTGQPLPLISRGGTSTVINCAYIGMILSVSYYTDKLEREAEVKEENSEADIPEILRDEQ